ncbi:MAG: hypothetical protein U0359_04855 [Byssovorax sp.]
MRSEEEELILEIAGMVADMLGMVDPTPISDTTSAGLAFYQGDVLGGVLSLVGIIPYLGDLAKMGKMPKYLGTLKKAIALAAKKPSFAVKMKPLLKRLKAVLNKLPLDMLPASVTSSVSQMKAELNAVESLATSPSLSHAIANLTGDLRKRVSEVLALPHIKNPRQLAKHHGPISERKLVEELESKSFKKVKEGTHGPGGTPKYGGQPESSDVYMRRIRGENGEELFEVVRIDKHTPNPLLGNPTLKEGSTKHFKNPKGEIIPRDAGKYKPDKKGLQQAEAKPYQRTHHSLDDPNTPANKMDYVSDGLARKSDFSHWHRETFPATDDNLVSYMGGPGEVKGLLKFDPAGFPVKVP